MVIDRTIQSMPVTVAELRSNLRITSTDLDTELEPKLLSAIEWAEGVIGTTIGLSEITERFALPAPVVLLPRTCSSVTGVEVDGEPLDIGECTWTLRDGLIMPEDTEGNYVDVTYVAGMARVPNDIRQAIILKASAMFNNPVDTVEVLTNASYSLLRRYRRWELR